jgi:spore coat polysaccharide biosynthesis predicted glycosyltransferase SpsG
MFVLHAAGGSVIGIGHLSRCQSLAQELLRQRAGEVVQLCEADAKLGERFAAPGAKLVLANDRASALELRERLAGHRPAVLITDLLDLDKPAEELARKQFGVLVHLNDSGLPAYQPDLLIDGRAFQRPENYPVMPRTKIFCGERYHIVRPSVAARRPESPWHGTAAHKVLLCFGGADPGQQTELFVGELAKGKSSCQFTVVAGPAFTEARRKALEALMSGRSRMVNAPTEMAGLILEHDVVVTLGGLTSYEAMCLGRPVCSVAWAHMKPYVEKLAAAGVLRNLGEGKAAVEVLCGALGDMELLRKLAENGWKAIDGKGAERAAREIINHSSSV